MLFSSWHHCHQDMVGHGFCFHQLFLPLLFPHFPLATSSTNSLQLLLFVFLVLHSPSTLSRSHLMQLSQHILSLPHLIFPSTSWACALCAILSSPILSIWLTSFNLLLANFFVKLSYAPTGLHYEFVHSSQHSKLSQFFLPSCVCTFSCFCISAIISRPYVRWAFYVHLPSSLPLSSNVCPYWNPPANFSVWNAIPHIAPPA